jgi:hypothetical protein
MVEVVGIFVATGNGEDARAQDVIDAVGDKGRVRGSAINPASLVAIPKRRSTTPSSRPPPSEVMRPPSKAAISFLRSMAGKPNGRIVSSDMAGVARCVGVDRMASTPNP